jgi:signal transduction histidine kinase
MNTLFQLDHRQYLRLLLQWRWLVLAIAIPVSLVIELLEGTSHALHFLDEVFIDGMVVPVVTWIVLTVAARMSARQFEREQELEQRQRFMQRLAEHRDYYGLAQFLVRYPSSILDVESVALFVYDQEHGRLDLVSEWRSPGAEEQAAGRAAQLGDGRKPALAEYRMLLIHGATQIGLLRLGCEPGKGLKSDRLAFFASLVPEMSLALALAIADAKEVERAYHEAQLHERRRITQELHDSLAQQVFYLNLGLDQLANDQMLQPSGDAVQRKLTSIRSVAAEVYEQIRNNLSILRAWEQVDIGEALGELARVTGHTNELVVEVSVEGTPRWLSPYTCEQLYSTVREALNNVVKHACAQRVQLLMCWDDTFLTVTLSDDGVGFDPAQLPTSGHYGLALMRETADALQGSLSIDSAPGRGTRVRLQIALETIDHLRLNKLRLQHAAAAVADAQQG